MTQQNAFPTITSDEEAFDYIRDFLIRQDCRSVAFISDKYTCRYRGDNGTMCAVGCLISDEYYSIQMEESTVSVERVLEGLKNSNPLWNIDSATIQMLMEIQAVHDLQEPVFWPMAFSNLEYQWFDN